MKISSYSILSERAFEWRADRPEGQRVVSATWAGSISISLAKTPLFSNPSPTLDATINPILSIKLQAFVATSLTRPSGQQTVFVIVQSQTLQAISNASGKATVRWPDGRTEDYYFTTNRAGLGTVSFNLQIKSRGIGYD